MQFPEDSPNIMNNISIKKLEIPIPLKKIAYGADMELPAITLQRALINLRSEIIEAIPVYEFSLLQTPYIDIKGIALFINDETEVKEALDSAWATDVNGILYTCNDRVKGKGNIKDIHIKSDPFCQINLALSLVYSVAKFTVNPRAEKLSSDLEDLSDIPSWAEGKIKELEGLREYKKIILSPIFYPAKNLLRKILNMQVELYNETTLDDSVVVYSGADYIYGRRIIFYLRMNNKKVKEFVLDTDPILSPIYLVLLAHFLKSRNEI